MPGGGIMGRYDPAMRPLLLALARLPAATLMAGCSPDPAAELRASIMPRLEMLAEELGTSRVHEVRVTPSTAFIATAAGAAAVSGEDAESSTWRNDHWGADGPDVEMEDLPFDDLFAAMAAPGDCAGPAGATVEVSDTGAVLAEAGCAAELWDEPDAPSQVLVVVGPSWIDGVPTDPLEGANRVDALAAVVDEGTRLFGPALGTAAACESIPADGDKPAAILIQASVPSGSGGSDSYTRTAGRLEGGLPRAPGGIAESSLAGTGEPFTTSRLDVRVHGDELLAALENAPGRRCLSVFVRDSGEIAVRATADDATIAEYPRAP